MLFYSYWSVSWLDRINISELFRDISNHQWSVTSAVEFFSVTCWNLSQLSHVTSEGYLMALPGLPDFYQGRAIPTSVLRLQSGRDSGQDRLADCRSIRNNCHFGCCQSDLVAPSGSLIIGANCLILPCSYHHCQYRTVTWARYRTPLTSHLIAAICNPWYGGQDHIITLSMANTYLLLSVITMVGLSDFLCPLLSNHCPRQTGIIV